MLKINNTEKIFLSKDFFVIRPKIDFFLRKINFNEYFSFSKLNHAFWEAASNHAVEYWKITNLHTKEFLDEVIQIVENWTEEIMLGVGVHGASYISLNKNNLFLTIKNMVPDKITMYDALTWKNLSKNSDLNLLWHELEKNKIKVKIIGLSHLSGFCSVRGFEFYEVNINATEMRFEILKQLIESHQEDTLYGFQCGELLSTWFIKNLHEKLPKAYLIDFGRALDYDLSTSFSDKDSFIYKKMTQVSHLVDLESHFPNFKKQLWQSIL